MVPTVPKFCRICCVFAVYCRANFSNRFAGDVQASGGALKMLGFQSPGDVLESSHQQVQPLVFLLNVTKRLLAVPVVCDCWAETGRLNFTLVCPAMVVCSPPVTTTPFKMCVPVPWHLQELLLFCAYSPLADENCS